MGNNRTVARGNRIGAVRDLAESFSRNYWIIVGWGTARCMGTARCAHTVEQFGKPVAGSVPTIVRAFKSAVTRQINQVRQIPGAPVWQRYYYEHILRDERAYRTIAAYILDNPRRWEADQFIKTPR